MFKDFGIHAGLCARSFRQDGSITPTFGCRSRDACFGFGLDCPLHDTSQGARSAWRRAGMRFPDKHPCYFYDTPYCRGLTSGRASGNVCHTFRNARVGRSEI